MDARAALARFVSGRRTLGPLVALVATYALFAALAPDTFTRTSNLVTMARQTTVVSICAVGMTLIIVSGGIDLSVGSTVAFTTVVVAAALKAGVRRRGRGAPRHPRGRRVRSRVRRPHRGPPHGALHRHSGCDEHPARRRQGHRRRAED